VVFCDLTSAFCLKIEPTLRELVERNYREGLRIVWKAYPIDVNKNGAEDAVELAFEARAQKGDEAFWKVHDALLDKARAQDGALSRRDLEVVAKESGLDAKAAMRAVSARKHIDTIDADRDLASDLGVYAVPHTFVNGRSVSGAGSADTFAKYIDEEIVRANALIEAGTAPDKVYEALQQKARPPEASTPVAMPEPKNQPSLGDSKAPVVVHVLSDVRQKETAALWKEIRAMDKEVAKKALFVWHHAPGLSRPLCAPADDACRTANAAEVQAATLGAEALAETFELQGNVEFWTLLDVLFAKQDQAWTRASLEQDVHKPFVSPSKVGAAVEARKHKAQIEADAKLVESAQARSLPFVVVNGRAVPGATGATLARAIRRAVREAKGPGAR